MAIRQIKVQGDEILTKVCKPIKEVTPHIRELAQDMLDTMYQAEGVGLAGPQVGVMKRIFVVDIYDGPEENPCNPHIFINPEILETSGSQTGSEGCLSIPGKAGQVTRPNYVKVKATNLNGEEFIMEGEELLARAILHENDHLDGHLYVEKVEGELYDVMPAEEEEEDEEDEQ